MSALVAVRALRTAINNGTVPWSRSYASSTKASGGSGGGSSSVQDPPSNVFKKVTSKGIGPGASKEGEYKNPEYFQYHNMSYAEMEIVMEKMRVPQPSAKQPPPK